MCDLNPDMVVDWAAEPDTLDMDSEGPAVTTLELLLEGVDPDLYPGQIDQDFGKGCRSAVTKLQQWLLLQETGEADPLTKSELARMWQNAWHPGQPFQPHGMEPLVLGPRHPVLGGLSDLKLGQIEAGKMSTFGGPRDSGDRIYTQSYIRGAKSPAELISKRADLVAMGILMNEEQALAATYGRRDSRPRGTPFFGGDLSKWPMTSDWKKREKRASTSSMLNPAGYYCAMRWRIHCKSTYINAQNPRLLIWSEETRLGCVVLRADWGPHVTTRRILDISRGAADAMVGEVGDGLRLPTDSVIRVAWAPDGIPLGPVQIYI